MSMKLSVEVSATRDSSPSALAGGGGDKSSVTITIEGADFGGQGYGRLPLGTLDHIFDGARKTLAQAQGARGAK